MSSSSVSTNVNGQYEELVTPSMFFGALRDAFKEEQPFLVENWYNWRAYTTGIYGRQKSVLVRMQDSLNLRCVPEYWKIDAVFCQKFHEESYFRHPTYAKQIDVVVEHENNCSHAHEEINKICILDSPLGVVITYPEQVPKDILLKEYAAVAVAADRFKDFADKRKKMVVFGSLQDQQINLEAYVFDGQRFVPLEVSG